MFDWSLFQQIAWPERVHIIVRLGDAHHRWARACGMCNKSIGKSDSMRLSEMVVLEIPVWVPKCHIQLPLELPAMYVMPKLRFSRFQAIAAVWTFASHMP
jgi:hypothetical protein